MNPHPDRSHAPLAEVIPLWRQGNGHARGGATDPDLVAASTELTHAIAMLERRCGSQWVELPVSLGRPAVRAEELLIGGPTAVDASTSPMEVANRAAPLLRAATAVADLVEADADILAEALGSALVDLPFHQLYGVVSAVMDLGLAPCVEPAWAAPAAADAADTVLAAFEAQLRPTTQLHDQLYADFTDHVLELQDAQLRAGDRPWRLIARAKLRRRLASASRTGRLPGDLRTVARKVLAVHESRRRLSALAPLLSTHLGHREWGPLTDVDAVVTSLAAVRRLQSVLGDRLAPDRLASLLTAGAFQSPVLVRPATNLRTALDQWRIDVAADSGHDPWASTASALAAWATSTSAVLPAITAGTLAMAVIDRGPTTLRALVDDLLLRERAADLAENLDACDEQHRNVRFAEPGSAS